MKSMFSGIRQKASLGNNTGAPSARMSSACLPIGCSSQFLYTSPCYFDLSLTPEFNVSPCMRTPKYARNIAAKEMSRKDHRFSV